MTPQQLSLPVGEAGSPRLVWEAGPPGPGRSQPRAPTLPSRRPSSGPHSWARAGASGPLVPRLPGPRPARRGSAAPPPAPAAASAARGGRQVSSPRPRAATRTPRSRNASLLGSKQLFLWSQPPLSTCGDRRQGGLFQATIPHSFLLSCEKARPPPHSERNPYFPFESPSLGAPVDVRARPSIFSSGRLPGPHSSGREAGRP